MTAEERLIHELRAAGVPVEDDLQELAAVRPEYPLLVPILVRWLEHVDEWSDPDDAHGRLEDSIVRALGYPSLRSQAKRLAVPALIRRFQECREERQWVVGLTLSPLAGAKFHDQIIPMIQNRDYGQGRNQLVLATDRGRSQKSLRC